MNDTFPTKIGDQLKFLQNVSESFMAAPEDYRLKTSEAAAFAALIKKFQTANRAVESARTHLQAQTVAFHEARTAAVKAYRQKARSARANGKVTDEALAKISVRRRARQSTVAAPTEAPVVALEKQTPGFVVISLRQSGGARSLPRSVLYAELSLVNGAATPANGDAERGDKRCTSRCLARVSTGGCAPQMRLYARWRTRSGATSPWSLAVDFRPQI